jgi:hypothetical protein
MDMDKQDIGMILVSQLAGLMKDSRYSYVTSTNDPEYSHLREPGEKIMMELVKAMFKKVVAIELAEDRARAEQLVMENLKK